MEAMRRAAWFALAAAACGCSDDAATSTGPGADGLPRCEEGSEPEAAPEPVHEMSYTRLLRRVMLTLTGTTPSSEAYQAMLDAPSDEARRALLDDAIAEALASTAFYRSMVAFGHDWFGVGEYAAGRNLGYHGSQAVNLLRCPEGSIHEDRWSVTGEAGGPSACNDAAAEVNAVEPWWAMGTTIEVAGRGGTGVTSYTASDGTEVDCGIVREGYDDNVFDHDVDHQCSCGPNLVYCHPHSGRANTAYRDPSLAAMQVWDEPARLLAHVVWQDRSLTDVVLANYTVAPLRLRHLYVRYGRQNPAHTALDATSQWYGGPFAGPADPEHEPSDPLAWNEVVVETLDPDLLALTADQSPSASLERTYTHDARTTTDEVEGMPAAGVLTMVGSLGSFERERVRAARFIEVFTCRQFVPPPGDFVFDDFSGDPATSGTCQHCHRNMDPAAIFFKRWSFVNSYALLGGTGRWRFTKDTKPSGAPYTRWLNQFQPGTVLTPATEAEVEANPEALLLDFLPKGTLLFGEQGDGTTGPLGFGKILVQSGEFDRCAVQRLYQRFAGRALDPAKEAGYLETLRKSFVDGERKVRPFVRQLLSSAEFRRGL
jgi:hypothetical protein